MSPLQEDVGGIGEIDAKHRSVVAVDDLWIDVSLAHARPFEFMTAAVVFEGKGPS